MVYLKNCCRHNDFRYCRPDDTTLMLTQITQLRPFENEVIAVGMLLLHGFKNRDYHEVNFMIRCGS